MKLLLLGLLVAFANAEQLRVGFNLPELSNRIVGGSEASKGQFPHQVSLQWGMPPLIKSKHFCGGSIINENWILTAGHCILAVPAYGQFIVKAGKHSLKSNEPLEQSVQVLKSIVHEKYKGGVNPYDIALIKLKNPLILNKAVNKINLPKQNSEHTGQAILSGWGSVSTINTMPDTLQTVKIPLIDIRTCKNAIESLTGPSPLHETNVCTGPLTGGTSACSGDSGGPLMAQISPKSSEIIGVVSWGIMPCGTVGAPSVYTKVSAYVNWLQNTMAKN